MIKYNIAEENRRKILFEEEMKRREKIMKEAEKEQMTKEVPLWRQFFFFNSNLEYIENGRGEKTKSGVSAEE